MKSYTFVLNFGYVESAGLCYMPWSSELKFKSAKEALVDLAEFLKEQYLNSHKVELKKCCKASKEKDSEAEFCSKCGRALQEEEFDSEDFEEWLSQMDGHRIDGFGEYVDFSSDERWEPGYLEGAKNPRFVYNAEWVLSAALGYPHRDDQTFEEICKERTKEKRESFSYY
jgi:hypothetical protein